MDKLIITAAICGAEVTKEQNPNVPYTVEEIVREAKSAVDAGAAIVHLHVRWDDGTPTQDRARFQECEEAILKVCPNVILIPSTGGAVGMTPDERLQSTDTTPLPEMATLDCGTCNFGDEIFDNTMPTMRAFGKRMMERGIKPEYECFEMGHLDTILTMARKGEVPGNPMQFNFVLGVPGCTPATVANLCWLVNGIPAGSTWTVTGVGRHLSPWAVTCAWASRTTCTSLRACLLRATVSLSRRWCASPTSWVVPSPRAMRPARFWACLRGTNFRF